MSIKTKLGIIAVLSLSITVVVSAILYNASRRVERAIIQNRMAYDIVGGVFHLNLLLSDFLLSLDEQQAVAWEAAHGAVTDMLTRTVMEGESEGNTLDRIRECHRNAAVVFRELVEANREQKRDMDAAVAFLDLQQEAVGRLSSEMRGILVRAAALADANHVAVMGAQSRAMFQVGVCTGVITGVLALSLLVIAGAIVKPIGRLTDAAGIIAGGNLEHRVAVTGRDEIGRLGSAFNDMTAKLQDSYVGLQNAFNDMARKLREARREKKQDG